MTYCELKERLEKSLSNVKILQNNKIEIINETNNKKIAIEIEQDFGIIFYVFDKYHTHFSREIEYETLIDRINDILSDNFVVIAEYVNSNSTLKYKASRVVKSNEIKIENKKELVENFFGKDEIKNLYLNGGIININSWSGNCDKEITVQKGEFCW